MWSLEGRGVPSSEIPRMGSPTALACRYIFHTSYFRPRALPVEYIRVEAGARAMRRAALTRDTVHAPGSGDPAACVAAVLKHVLFMHRRERRRSVFPFAQHGYCADQRRRLPRSQSCRAPMASCSGVALRQTPSTPASVRAWVDTGARPPSSWHPSNRLWHNFPRRWRPPQQREEKEGRSSPRLCSARSHPRGWSTSCMSRHPRHRS